MERRRYTSKYSNNTRIDKTSRYLNQIVILINFNLLQRFDSVNKSIFIGIGGIIYVQETN